MQALAHGQGKRKGNSARNVSKRQTDVASSWYEMAWNTKATRVGPRRHSMHSHVLFSCLAQQSKPCQGPQPNGHGVRVNPTWRVEPSSADSREAMLLWVTLLPLVRLPKPVAEKGRAWVARPAPTHAR
eukprot:scaffold265904_cov23-Tisochrysis_lutea.AAC.1